LTKPDSALLSGEELNSCSHCERFLGNYTAACPATIIRMQRVWGRRAGDFSLPSFLSLPPNDFIGGSKESGNDFIICKWFGLIAFYVKSFGRMWNWIVWGITIFKLHY
jgi:hypothetical protein